MLSRLCVLVVSFGIAAMLPAREFTVLVYNVENLFDVDGVSVFPDYRQGEVENPYSPARLLTKVRHIGEVLAAVNDGAGPEVVLFQEFELDRTPFSHWRSADHFLKAFEGTTVEAMLTSDFSPRIAGLPAEAFLLKYLHDEGIGPYHVISPEAADIESAPVHQNAVFSKFPIRWVRERAMDSARDLLMVGLEVDGHELLVFNNHWKAGASNPRTESARVQNALVTRAELEAILIENPAADVIVAGDLNSHYNQAAVFPELRKTGINDILGSGIDEKALIEGRARGLYNLWGELPPADRGSEIYRGNWGTLMHLLVTRGLYDQAGMQYIDNSFFRLVLRGRNVEPYFGTPRAWTPFADGAGFSDHLPIGARFRTVETGRTKAYLSLEKPAAEAELPKSLPRIGYTLPDHYELPGASCLTGLSDQELAARFGELFIVEGKLVGENSRRVRIGAREFGLYAPAPETGEALDTKDHGSGIRTIGQLGAFRGELQFVLHDPSWLLD